MTDQFETVDITDLVESLRPPPLADLPPISADFEGDLIRYKLRFSYGPPSPVFFPAKVVPCRCAHWRTRIARFLGRHPRTHRIPSVLVTSI